VSLSFRNSSPARIWLVFAYNDSGCSSDGASWMKKGWWQIQPGGTVTVRGGASNGAKYFYYAKGDGGRRWSGQYGTTVPTDAFTQCWDIGTSVSEGVSMAKIVVPVTSFNYTLNLT
jgi:uncharacterized membrane protein